MKNKLMIFGMIMGIGIIVSTIEGVLKPTKMTDKFQKTKFINYSFGNAQESNKQKAEIPKNKKKILVKPLINQFAFEIHCQRVAICNYFNGRKNPAITINEYSEKSLDIIKIDRKIIEKEIKQRQIINDYFNRDNTPTLNEYSKTPLNTIKKPIIIPKKANVNPNILLKPTNIKIYNPHKGKNKSNTWKNIKGTCDFKIRNKDKKVISID